MRIKAYHQDLNLEQTNTTEKANKGQAEITIQNTAGLLVDDLIVIGKPTEEKTEIGRIQAITGKTITLTNNLSQSHSINTIIQKTLFNKVKFYKSTTGEDGPYIEVSTKDIAIDEPYTSYVDSSVAPNTYYKIAYYNSYTSTESDKSPAVSIGGFPKDSLISITERCLKQFGDTKEKILHREEIEEWANQAKDDLCNAVAETNEKYFSELLIGVISNGDTTITLPDTVKKIQKVSIKYAGEHIEAAPINIQNIDDDDRYSQYSPVYAFNNYKLEVRPGATADDTEYKIRIEANQNDLVDDNDRLPYVLRPYSHVVDLYVLAMAFRSDNEHNVGRNYMQDYEVKKDEMLEQINDLNLSYNRIIDEEY